MQLSTLAFMTFLPSLSAEELHRYHQVVIRAVSVRSHLDLLAWLQGDMQQYLPHDILIASWGNFDQRKLQHDVISPLAGVRSNDADTCSITPLMCDLYSRWTQFGKKAFTLQVHETGFLLDDACLKNAVGSALNKMRSAIVHGIIDERGLNNCLYVGFSTQAVYGAKAHGAMSVVLPYIDTALRQVEHLPHQSRQAKRNRRSGDLAGDLAGDSNKAAGLPGKLAKSFGLTDRESEVLHWVALGKTNPEIAIILDISAFTVKNHMQRMFRKLNVSNRAQAVSKYQPSATHDQV